MRAAPAFRIDIPAQAGWRWMVAALVALALAAVIAWAVLPQPVLATSEQLGLASAALLALGLAWFAARSAACRLRWDGAEWWFGHADCSDEQMVSGQVRVMVDLSSFLLLRFTGAPARTYRTDRWIPIRRSGLEGQWHGLRCAVYSARLEPAHLSAGDLPLLAPRRPEPPE